MRTIKIGFADYFNPVDEFFMDILSQRYEVVRDDENPNYLFFCDETFGQKNLTYDEKKVKKIFYTGENRRPWNYRAHHAITFDHMDGPQFYRLPLYVLEEWILTKKQNMPSIEEPLDVPEKTDFCAFVASNGGCQIRNDIFHKLSQYKKVNSGGALFNNIGGALPRGPEAHLEKIKFFGKHKFSLCYENSSFPGYVTEKLYYGLYARTVPIYWGSPCVEMDFGLNSFVSRHDFRSDDEMIEYIKFLDNDNEAYNDALQSSIWPYQTTKNPYMNLDNFLNWFEDHVEVK